jgi:chromosome segregation ATPase
MASFTDDLTVTDDNIRSKHSTIDCIQNELKLKRQEFDELKKIEKDKTNVYASWMSDCLNDIKNDNRFSQKPIGPIGQYIRCMNPHWSYALEKHLAPIMSAFICANSHDERILLEIFSKHTRDHRPQIYTRKFSDRVPDISGTLDRVRRANLLSIYQVLRIDNITVECALIDYRQIEATILVDNLEHAKRIRQSGVLRWEKIPGKVKQVVEAWTHDGSNVKLDSAFRIYTNDKQPARFFTSNNTESQSYEELNLDIKVLSDQLNNVNGSINELKKIRQTTSNNLEKMKKNSIDNKKRMKELNKVI